MHPASFELSALPQHDPSLRERFATLGSWDLRQLPSDDFRLPYFLAHRLFHVQILNLEARTSILSPSRLTNGCWDVLAANHGRWALRDFGAVNVCLVHLGLAPIEQKELFVVLAEHRLEFDAAADSNGRAPRRREGGEGTRPLSP